MKQNRTIKRIISLFIAFVMLSTMQPIVSYAAEIGENESASENYVENNDSIVSDEDEDDSRSEELVTEEDTIVAESEETEEEVSSDVLEEESVETQIELSESDTEEDTELLGDVEYKYYRPYDDATYELKYHIQEDGTISIDGYKGTAKGKLIIPENIDGTKVSDIGSQAFKNCKNFTGDLVIPNGIVQVGYCAFFNCEGLSSLTISNNMKTIGSQAFDCCYGLKGNLIIPDSVIAIGSYAFEGCSGLTGDLIIPDGVKKISEYAFYNCSGFDGTLSIPNSVSVIDEWAFAGCSGFTGALTIPNSVKEVGETAFSGCSGFTSLTLSNRLTTIKRYAFGNMKGLTSLSIPNSVINIEGGAFSGCSGLKGNLLIPNSVKSIEWEAFQNCSDLTGVLSLPSGLVNVSKNAFNGCSGITSLYLPKTVRNINENAFNGCNALKTVYYDGTPSEWDAITIYEGNDILSTVTVNYLGNDDPDEPGLDPYTATLKFGQETFKFVEWSPSKLLVSKNFANMDLSRICLILSRRAYGDADEARNSLDEALVELSLVDDDAESLRDSLITTRNRWNIRYTEDLLTEPAHTFALKKYTVNGETYNIITVVIRGSQDGTDWGINFAKDGYKDSAADLFDEIETFLAIHGIGITDENNRFLITGHSLGGAVANVLQHDIIMDARESGKEGYEKKVICYTYASPLTFADPDKKSREVGYSMNFIHPEDHYVTQHYNDKDAPSEEYVRGVKVKWYNFIHMRYGKDIDLGYISSQAKARYKLYSGTDLDQFIGSLLNPIDKLIEQIKRLHSCEMYMALLNSNYEEMIHLINSFPGFTGHLVSAYCPVDVSITDKESGETLACIQDNEILFNNTDNIQISVADEHKFLKIPSDSSYVVKIAGNNSGTMNYEVQSIETDSNGVYLSNTSRFVDVGVFDGKTMDCPIEQTAEKEGIRLYVTDENGIPVKEVLEDGTEEDIPNGFYIKEINESGYTYTGSSIKPEVKVYCRETLLKEKSDYTISYNNNTNVGDAAQITVTGKGNYKGKETDTFKIIAKDISESDVLVSEIASVGYNKKKNYTPIPTLTYNKKKLKNKKDFMVEYYADEECAGNTVIPKEAGKYYAKINGIKNFTGNRVVSFEIAGNDQIPVSKLTIGKIPAQQYSNGTQITPELTIKYNGATLTKDTDYTVSWGKNTEIGTVSVTITGKEPYVGTRTITFNISGISLSKATISGIPKSLVYDGTAKTPTVTLKYKANKNASEEPIPCAVQKDYDSMSDDEKADIGCIVSYDNNINVGTAAVTLTGIHGCAGTVKKTFKITPFVVTNDPDDQFVITLTEDTYAYAKSGAKPKPAVSFKGSQLKEGKDYTLAYANNTSVNDGTGKKKPTVKVTGKGNFKGTDATTTFKIGQADMSVVGVAVNAKDVVYKNKAGNWKTKITLAGVDGKALKAGKDYDDKQILYSYDEAGNDVIPANATVPAGTTIYVKINAKGNIYTGSATGSYRVIGQDIGKLTASIDPKTYTGKKVRLSPGDITWKSGSKRVEGVTVEIDETTYKNNLNKGKATVMIRGTGDWGGTKTVKYTIGARGFLWWWRNLTN